MKYLLAVLMMGLLSACSLGASSPSEATLPSINQADESTSASMDNEGSDEAEASESADASEDMIASCQDAWESIDLTDVATAGDLDAIATDLDDTLESCGNVSDWRDQANSVLPMIDASEIEDWAATRCSENDTLSDSPVCLEINS